MREMAGAVLVGVLLLSSCAQRYGYRDGVVYTQRASYAIGPIDELWSVRKDKGSDALFRNEALGAALYVDSTCRNFQDAPLSVLANHLFFGFDEAEVRHQRIHRIDNRDALERLVRARLDGAEVGVAVTVLKKNACVFDIILVAPADAFDDLVPFYREIVGGFRTL